MKIKTWTLCALACLTLFVGCKSGWIRAKQMNQVRIGMTREETAKVLGQPHSTESDGRTETLWYREDEGGWIHQPYYVKFEGGKVISYGRGETPVGRGGNSPPVIIMR